MTHWTAGLGGSATLQIINTLHGTNVQKENNTDWEELQHPLCCVYSLQAIPE